MRAEKDDLEVFDRAHAVPRRPVKKVILFTSINFFFELRYHEFSRNHVATIPSITGVVLESI
jgi:hypothetical protein